MPVWPSCYGACRSTTSESAVVPSATPGSRSTNAWPARPRQAAVRHILGSEPLRAVLCLPSDVGVRTELIAPYPPSDGAALFLIETDSISLIGPTNSPSERSAVTNRFHRRVEHRYHQRHWMEAELAIVVVAGGR